MPNKTFIFLFYNVLNLIFKLNKTFFYIKNLFTPLKNKIKNVIKKQ